MYMDIHSSIKFLFAVYTYANVDNHSSENFQVAAVALLSFRAIVSRYTGTMSLQIITSTKRTSSIVEGGQKG